LHSINYSSPTDEPYCDRGDGENLWLPHIKKLPFVHRASSDDGYFKPNTFLQHLDEMTKALSELSQSRDVVERSGYDEVWMLPSNTKSEKKSVTIADEPAAVSFNKDKCAKAKEAAQVESGVVEQEELVSSDRSNFLTRLLFVLFANCTAGLAVTLFWAIFFLQ
jgi:hypothetical protein